MSCKNFFQKSYVIFICLFLAVIFSACSSKDDVPAYGTPSDDYKALYGIVYVDSNKNEKYDSGEEVSGVKVRVETEDVTKVSYETPVTTSDGTYTVSFFSDKDKVSIHLSTGENSQRVYEEKTVEVDFSTAKSISDYNIAVEIAGES
ncbi:hypothetical protein HNP77_002279 [Treponema rectale]|uniref:Carboxypeptidase regulatory-like domain-containing protein n=1 Tax=Treponema rectale TaxID=744512 RepID=A0A840SGM6_9SPIR|nr:hypothetical protein [Treponema rectale]MBB5219890.1 hypothetical protein [Treponema rectale]